jgi:hypothetical protein
MVYFMGRSRKLRGVILEFPLRETQPDRKARAEGLAHGSDKMLCFMSLEPIDKRASMTGDSVLEK